MVILDEAHERTIHTEILFALIKGTYDLLLAAVTCWLLSAFDGFSSAKETFRSIRCGNVCYT